jgi:CBS domain-containing protein
MSELDVGALPVGDGDELVGMITDRDTPFGQLRRASIRKRRFEQ